MHILKFVPFSPVNNNFIIIQARRNQERWCGWGTSQVVQWLRFRVLSPGGLGLIPGQEIGSHMPPLGVHVPKLTK